MRKYEFDRMKFRKMRLPWLLLALSPSFMLDLFIIYMAVTGDASVTDHDGRLMVKLVGSLLIGNALLLKSWGLMVYFIFRNMGKRSYITLKGGEVVYCKYKSDFCDSDSDSYLYEQYHIESIAKLRHRADGSLVAIGDILVTYYNEYDEIHHQGVKRRCVIPAYYQGLDRVATRLEELLPITGPDGVERAAV